MTDGYVTPEGQLLLSGDDLLRAMKVAHPDTLPIEVRREIAELKGLIADAQQQIGEIEMIYDQLDRLRKAVNRDARTAAIKDALAYLRHCCEVRDTLIQFLEGDAPNPEARILIFRPKGH